MIGISIVLTSTVAAMGAAAMPAKETTLEDEVAMLRKRVEELESRLRAIESAPPRITLPRSLPHPPVPSPHKFDRWREFAPRNLPRGTEQREFNGMTFYVIPVQNDAAAGTAESPTIARSAKE